MGSFVRDVGLPLSGLARVRYLLLYQFSVFTFGLLIIVRNPNRLCLWFQILLTLASYRGWVMDAYFHVSGGLEDISSGHLSISMSWSSVARTEFS